MRAPPATYSRTELIGLLVDLLEPPRRPAAIKAISHLLGVDSFVLFVPDSEIGRLLAAPGFPQTFPERKVWLEFIAASGKHVIHRAALPWLEPNMLVPALGLPVGSNSVLVVLGGNPAVPEVAELGELLQLIVPGLVCERTVATVGVQLQLAHQATRESSALAATLDDARRAAQAEVAARKRAELELRQARDELARVNLRLEDRVRARTEQLRETIAELEAFSFTVSHDLRAPLRTMYGYADALMEEAGPRLSPNEKEHLARISRAGHRLDGMIQDVLRYSRISRAEIELRPVELSTVVRDVIQDDVVLEALRGQIEIIEPLPVVRAQEVLLAQCISNLLRNAVTFVRSDVPPRVRVFAEHRAKIVRVWIEDNGIGIAGEDMKRLFGMFERFQPTSQFEGNGVGLAIVNEQPRDSAATLAPNRRWAGEAVSGSISSVSEVPAATGHFRTSTGNRRQLFGPSRSAT